MLKIRSSETFGDTRRPWPRTGATIHSHGIGTAATAPTAGVERASLLLDYTSLCPHEWATNFGLATGSAILDDRLVLKVEGPAVMRHRAHPQRVLVRLVIVVAIDERQSLVVYRDAVEL